MMSPPLAFLTLLLVGVVILGVASGPRLRGLGAACLTVGVVGLAWVLVW